MALEKEFNFYVKNQAKLAARYDGRFIAIKGTDVLGDYDSLQEALVETAKDHKPGTFLVQQSDPDPQSIASTFRSRVSFG